MIGFWARRTSCRRRREDGAAVLEFGLIFPVLMLLIFGLIQYGYYFWSLQTAAAAAREGARRLIVGTDPACTSNEAISKMSNAALGGVTPTFTFAYQTPGVAKVGELVTVTTSFKALKIGIPFMPLPDGGYVTGKAEARVESIPGTPLGC